MSILEELFGRGGVPTATSGPYEDKTTAEEALRTYLKLPVGEFEEGDSIERNEIGRKRYNSPKENQVAICVKRYDKPVFSDDSGDFNDALMAVVLAKDVFRYYEVNSKYYRKTGSNTTNIFSFKKK